MGSTLLIVGTVLGQEPTKEEVVQPTKEEAKAELPVNPPTPSSHPPYQMNYQGYLTDGNGNPLEGQQSLEFSMYDTYTNGLQLWGPESHANVELKRGLFNIVLGETKSLRPDIFKQALFLQVKVNETTMATQTLRTVPYAFNLLPGATLEGDPLGSVYALTVINTGTTAQSRGVWAVGNQYGLLAQETGTGDVAIRSTSFVEAQGYKSTAPSYWWVSGMSGLAANPAELTMRPTLTGTAILSSTLPGTQYFYLPVSLPSQLYGQEVAVKNLTVYYYVADSHSYIAATRMEKLTAADSSETLIDESIPLTSTLATSYTLTTTGNYTLTESAGPLNVQFTLYFSDTTQPIYLGAIRLLLAHDD